MKAWVVMILFVPYIFTLGISCVYADKTSVTAAPLMRTKEKVGKSDAYLEPTLFPYFYGYESDNKSCGECLKGKKMSYRKRSDFQDSGDKTKGYYATACDPDATIYNNKHCKYYTKWNSSTGEYSCSSESTDNCGGFRIGQTDFKDLDGLEGTVEIDSAYLETAKVLFTWTVRVEGYIPQDCNHNDGKVIKGVHVWPGLCKPWHGSSKQEFDGGQVKTLLFVSGEVNSDKVPKGEEKVTISKNGSEYEHTINYNTTDIGKDADTGEQITYTAIGKMVEMTVPPLGTKKISVKTPGDPTLTGSLLLTKEYFKDGIPETIHYKLKWYNDTPLKLKSPKNERNIVVTVLPITDNQESE